MDYETSVKLQLEKQIYSEYTVDNRAPVKMKESEREETNTFFMTIEDMVKHGIIENNCNVRECSVFGKVLE